MCENINIKNKIRKKNLFSISAGGKQGEHWEEGGETVIDGEGSPSPEAPVECPELGCSSLWGVPNPGAAFQDKGGWGGERLGRGRGRKEGYKGRGPGGREPGGPWRMSPGRSDRFPAAAQSPGTPWTAGPALCWSPPRICWWLPSIFSCWRWCWGPSCCPLSPC